MLPSILSPFASAHIHLLSTKTCCKGDVGPCCGAGHQNRIGKSQMREEGQRSLRFFPLLPCPPRNAAAPRHQWLCLPVRNRRIPPRLLCLSCPPLRIQPTIPRKPLRTRHRPQHQPPTPMSSPLIHGQNASSASCPISLPSVPGYPASAHAQRGFPNRCQESFGYSAFLFNGRHLAACLSNPPTALRR
jgi:hypothetical protein